MSIRDIRNKARASLHNAMKLDAIYIAPDGSEVALTVRVHHRTQAFGDMSGFDYSPAERIDRVPEIICLAADLSPVQGGKFSIEAGEAYEVELPLPQDGLTITSQCTRMTAQEAVGLPVPAV